jgi:translocation and assembly module TamA
MNGHIKSCIAIGLLALLPLMSWSKTIIRYQINGINDPLLKNAQTMLTAEQNNITKDQTNVDPSAIRQFFNQGSKIIGKAIQPYGYFSPTINSELIQDKDTWTLVYTVNPGAAIKLRNLKIEITGPGADNPIFAKWRANVPLKEGAIFNVPDYNQTTSSFFDLTQDQGYLQARLLTHSLNIDVNTLTATVVLKFSTGPQYFYGPVTFSHTKLSEDFLKHYLNFKEGDPFSITKILIFQENLSNSGYFKKVDVIYDIKNAIKQIIPLHVNLSPDDTMLYSIGAGYGTDTGYRASAGWQWQLINSQGQHLGAQYNISQIGNSASVTYYIPGQQPMTEQYQLNATTAAYNTIAGRSWLQSYSGVYNVTDGNWQTSYGLTYQFEKYIIPNLTPESVHLVMPSVTWSYLQTDHILRPNYGTRFSIMLRGATDKFVSSVNFAQTEIDLHHLLSINNDNRLLFRSSIGATTTSDFNLVPLSLQFTAGGAQSIRGFAYQSLGPGQYLLSGSLQYEYRIHGNWFAAIFHDQGNAFDSFSNMGIVQSGGTGVIWESPIGTMELDAAKAINNTAPVMLAFSIGGLL